MALARLAAAVRAVNGAFPDLANGHSHAVRAERAGQGYRRRDASAQNPALPSRPDFRRAIGRHGQRTANPLPPINAAQPIEMQ